jgi:hypothetical protein
MNTKLVDLLKYKKPLDITIGGEVVAKKWVRIIGDSDLQEAYKLARIASAKIRKELKNPKSMEYQDHILPIEDAPKEDCIALIIASQGRQFEAEADANIERPDLPELDEVAIDADAPTLEEQEKLDTEVDKLQEAYQKAKEDYVKDRVASLEAELKSLPTKELKKRTEEESVNTVALTTFLVEAQAEKVWRSIYTDKSCTEREYNNRQEFQDTDTNVRNQIFTAYSNLEVNGEDIKN